MNNAISSGDRLEVTIAGSPVVGGTVGVVGNVVGVWAVSAAVGKKGILLRVGEFTLPKLNAQAWAIGVRLYYDEGNSHVTSVASTHKPIGYAGAAAANPSTTGAVVLAH